MEPTREQRGAALRARAAAPRALLAAGAGQARLPPLRVGVLRLERPAVLQAVPAPRRRRRAACASAASASAAARARAPTRRSRTSSPCRSEPARRSAPARARPRAPSRRRARAASATAGGPPRTSADRCAAVEPRLGVAGRAGGGAAPARAAPKSSSAIDLAAVDREAPRAERAGACRARGA